MKAANDNFGPNGEDCEAPDPIRPIRRDSKGRIISGSGSLNRSGRPRKKLRADTTMQDHEDFLAIANIERSITLPDGRQVMWPLSKVIKWREALDAVAGRPTALRKWEDNLNEALKFNEQQHPDVGLMYLMEHMSRTKGKPLTKQEWERLKDIADKSRRHE